MFGLDTGAFVLIDVAAGKQERVNSIHSQTCGEIKGVFLVPYNVEGSVPFRILSVSQSGEVNVWMPGDVKTQQVLNEEVTHVDMKHVNNDSVLLIGTKGGFMHTYTVTNGRVQPLGVIREYGNKSPNLKFNVLGACLLKIFSGNLCVLAAKSYGDIGIWKVQL